MAKKKRKKKKQHRFFWFVIKLQIVLMLLVLGAAGVYFFGGYADEVQQIRREAIKEVAASDESLFIPSQTCSVYDTNGNLISERKGDKDAQYVKYEDIPKSFVTAIISIEDKKFYRHNGVDFKAIMRAVKARLQAGKVTQGGSNFISIISISRMDIMVLMQRAEATLTVILRILISRRWLSYVRFRTVRPIMIL